MCFGYQRKIIKGKNKETNSQMIMVKLIKWLKKLGGGEQFLEQIFGAKILILWSKLLGQKMYDINYVVNKTWTLLW